MKYSSVTNIPPTSASSSERLLSKAESKGWTLGRLPIACLILIVVASSLGAHGDDPQSPDPRSPPILERPYRLPMIARPSRLPLVANESDLSLQPTPSVAVATLESPQVLKPDVQDTPGANETIDRRFAFPSTKMDFHRFDRFLKAQTVSTLLSGDSLPEGERESLQDVAKDTKSASPQAFELSAAFEAQKRFYNDFSPTPIPEESATPVKDAEWVYDSKKDVPTQHPLIEWGGSWYGDGTVPRGINWFGEKNLIRPKFYLYGDYRTSIASGRNASGRTDNWAHRLNLDMDLQFTGTERFHAFVGPLDDGGRFTRLELVEDDVKFRNEVDFTPLTAFFEGDLGVLLGAAQNRTSPFELPFTIGLVPLLFQNGIWMEDAVTGAAFALPRSP